jgi:hypothetical protein
MVAKSNTGSQLSWEKKWFVMEANGQPFKKELDCYRITEPESGYIVKMGCIRHFVPAGKCYQTEQEAGVKVAELQSLVGVREQLAAYAHEAWSCWMKYLFSKCTPLTGGGLAIDRSLVERWERQMNTPYAELSEDEKASDRDEAHKMLDIMAKAKS